MTSTEAVAHHGPTVLVLSRQSLPILDPAVLDVKLGATVIAAGDEAAIVASGSEVHEAIVPGADLVSRGPWRGPTGAPPGQTRRAPCSWV